MMNDDVVYVWLEYVNSVAAVVVVVSLLLLVVLTVVMLMTDMKWKRGDRSIVVVALERRVERLEAENRVLRRIAGGEWDG